MGTGIGIGDGTGIGIVDDAFLYMINKVVLKNVENVGKLSSRKGE